MRHLRVILSVCVCLYGARVRMCTGVCHIHPLTQSVTFVFVCVFE